ncbi:DUF3813 domain-containing protein [Evansella tamaricis]|uniref:DUF3813 domain-containing protein n=1 Tax=Evansella tamaricis TaxID=2069301 RepID=A0ABS6JCW4_9BACI|nr:DUF3813 domain-containing protein [Evansella tamaricis]MBU9711486.1 DUF3813 domain-containing protein [Evansella tamaricis]
MANQYFQQAREAVEAANQAVQNTTTPLEQAETVDKIKRAKQAISQAYADSSIAEREQLMELQRSFYEFTDEFMNESF